LYDTLKLRSPVVGQAMADTVGAKLYVRSAVRPEDGDVAYSYTHDNLRGSWENRISVKLQDAMVEEEPDEDGVVETLAGWRIVIEGSVHKAMLGHNVHGGPDRIVPAAGWFVDHVAALLGVELPPWQSWEVCQVDVADAYELPELAQIELVNDLMQRKYPKRKCWPYPNESVMWAGRVSSQSAIKVYRKGPEFLVHRKHIKNRLTPSELLDLQTKADSLIRVETSIRARWFRRLLGRLPTIAECDDAMLRALHEGEIARILNEGQEVQVTRDYESVKRLLQKRFQRRPDVAFDVLQTWMDLCVYGEDKARQGRARRTYYQHLIYLRECGISWYGGDVVHRESAIPSGFTLRGNTFRQDEVSPAVERIQRLERYRIAV